MKPPVIINTLLILVAMACSSKINPAAEIKSTAQLINMLPVDGCGWHFTVGTGSETHEYAASDASQEKVNTIIQGATPKYGVYSIDVEITYRLTGNKKSVQCGWGKTSEMEEIELSDIKLLP
ncbi:MAG: hypothetical protein U0X91_15205 [Spirosomataceae bacterium]